MVELEMPKGAIKKPWGWQIPIYQSLEREIWLGFGLRGGETSLHCHHHFDQNLRVLDGAIDTVGESGYRPSCWVPAGTFHKLVFCDDSLFVETYTRVAPTTPPVFEDTERR